jgi:DNA replication protein DnaC
MTLLKQSLEEMGLNGMGIVIEQMIEEGKELDEVNINLLQRLIIAERESRLSKRTESLIRRAKFRYHSSVASIHTGVSRNLDKDFLDRLGTGRWIKQGQNLLITGPTGAGKSYLASALGYRACELGMKVLYFNGTKFWAGLRRSRSKGHYERDLRMMARSDLIILDDFGLAKMDSVDRMSLLEILEDRWGQASTIVVSQRPFTVWHEVLGEPTVADAICDRLFSNSEKIQLKGDSMRKTKTNS